MSPEELVAVERSWGELLGRHDVLVAALAGCLPEGEPGASARAPRMLEAMERIVALLPTPSRLDDHVRAVAGGPSPVLGPADGPAWIAAARAAAVSWTAATERAWQHAWLLVSDLLAEQAPSPFGPNPPPRPPSPT